MGHGSHTIIISLILNTYLGDRECATFIYTLTILHVWFKNSLPYYTKPSSTSLNTTFAVLFEFWFPLSLVPFWCSGNSTLTFLGWVHQDSATYNCPWLKTAAWRSSPTCCTLCPCDLFIVIANARWTGNWRSRRGIGNFAVFESIAICGMKTTSSFICAPAWSICFLRIWHCSTFLVEFNTITRQIEEVSYEGTTGAVPHDVQSYSWESQGTGAQAGVHNFKQF